MLVAFTPTSPAFVMVGIVSLMVMQIGHTFYGRLLGQLYPPDMRGRLQVLPLLAFSVAGALAGYGSGWLLDGGPSSYRWVVPGFSVAGVLSSILVMRLPLRASTVPPDRAGLWTCLTIGLHDRRFLLWTSVYSLTTIGFWVAYAATPVYLADILRLSYRENGLTIAAYHVAFCAGFAVWGRAVDRHGAQAVMAASWTVIALGLGCMFIWKNFPAAVLGQSLLGVGLGGNDIAWFVVVLEFAPDDRVDRYMGLYLVFFGARAIIGGLFAGALMTLSPQGSWIALGAGGLCALIGSLLMLAIRRQRSTEESK